MGIDREGRTVPCLDRSQRFILMAFLDAGVLAVSPARMQAGGPKYVAGATYFNLAVLGQPVHWSGG